MNKPIVAAALFALTLGTAGATETPSAMRTLQDATPAVDLPAPPAVGGARAIPVAHPKKLPHDLPHQTGCTSYVVYVRPAKGAKLQGSGVLHKTQRKLLSVGQPLTLVFEQRKGLGVLGDTYRSAVTLTIDAAKQTIALTDASGTITPATIALRGTDRFGYTACLVKFSTDVTVDRGVLRPFRFSLSFADPEYEHYDDGEVSDSGWFFGAPEGW